MDARPWRIPCRFDVGDESGGEWIAIPIDHIGPRIADSFGSSRTGWSGGEFRSSKGSEVAASMPAFSGMERWFDAAVLLPRIHPFGRYVRVTGILRRSSGPQVQRSFLGVSRPQVRMLGLGAAYACACDLPFGDRMGVQLLG
jgi:hypothetical protein